MDQHFRQEAPIIEIVPAHFTRVIPASTDDGYLTRCHCGYEGPFRHEPGDAVIDAARHEGETGHWYQVEEG